LLPAKFAKIFEFGPVVMVHHDHHIAGPVLLAFLGLNGFGHDALLSTASLCCDHESVKPIVRIIIIIIMLYDLWFYLIGGFRGIRWIYHSCPFRNQSLDAPAAKSDYVHNSVLGVSMR